MNVDVHDMLITKLEKGLEKTKDTSIELRLADLYSDRSRLKQIKENETDCNQCLKSNEDRKKSVIIYKKIFDKIDKNEQERVFEQISQSLTILNSSKEADEFYNRIIKNKYSNQLKAMAHLAQADNFFFNNQYSSAYKKFRTALTLSPNLESPIVKYRIAWCEFNSGNFESAKRQLTEILKEKDSIEPSLKSEIARDFARFSSKGKINKSTIKMVHNLSPNTDSKDNIEFLAEELDRQSRFYESLIVNHYLLEEFTSDNYEKSIAYIRIAQSELSLKRYNSVIESFRKSTEFYKNLNCKSSANLCDQYQEKAQKFVIYWNSLEKDQPSQNLIKIWTIYITLFTDKSDMHFLAAQTFYKIKDYAKAQDSYIKTAEILNQNSKYNKNKNSSQDVKLFNISLNAAMDSAEKSKKIENKIQAYQAYLKLNPEGEKNLEAKYQLAYLDYEQKKYKDALIAFNNIVKDYTKSKKLLKHDIAIKSANLVLDILAIQKANKEIMIYSLIYADVFTKQKDDFNSIYRKALINESLDTLKDKNSNKKYQSQLIDNIKKSKTHKTSQSEFIKINEVQLELAIAIQDLNEVKLSAIELINSKRIKPNIRNYALDKYIWASEIALEFSKAYEFALIRYPKKNRGQKELLKIGLLAELSGKNPNSFYEQALTKTRSPAEANQIRIKIVQNSRYPWKDLIKYKKDLSLSPLLLSELTLETYARFKNDKRAEEVLKDKRVASKPAGIQLQRYIEIPKFKKLEHQVSKHKIASKSESKTQKNIAERVQILSKIEKVANSAIERKDFTLQVASLSLLKNEKERLAKELSELPIPKGLNKKEQSMYNSILAQRVVIMQNESKKIAIRLEQAWKSQSYVKNMSSAFFNSSNDLKQLIAQEAKFLTAYAPDNVRSDLKRMFDIPKLDRKSLDVARTQVQEQPFNKDKIKNLLKLEKYNNRYTQVAFLEKRIIELDKGGL